MIRFLIIFLTLSQVVNAQNTHLYKMWVMNKAYDCSGKTLKNLDETYWNIIFKPGGVATILVNDNIKSDKKFTIKGNIINFNFTKYEISKISNDSLVLIDDKKTCLNYLFLSEQADKLNKQKHLEILKKQSNKYFLYKGDTVYIANSYNSPKMKNYPNHLRYFVKAFPNTSPRKDCVIQFKFIVQKDGKLLDPKGSISCSKKSERIVNRIIKDMMNKWQPMYINGKPVNSLMRVKYREKQNFKNEKILMPTTTLIYCDFEFNQSNSIFKK